MSSGAGSDVYEKAQEYWAAVASDVDGMLGGFAKLHVPDVNASKAFIAQLRKSKSLSGNDTALDCGSGIGRITKHLLLPMFRQVDMVDVTEKFIEDSAAYIGDDNSRIGQKYVESLHEFEPRERHYDLIWIQWVTGHLTDDDFVTFFRRCANGIKDGGCIVLKENLSSGDDKVFDPEDNSWTRPKQHILDLIEKTNLDVVMITALKKKLTPGNANGPPSGDPSPVRSRVPSGVNVVNAELQKKYAHGVNYNMKVVIRGDRNAGKTSLWRRLQGLPFDENYSPTEEIQATNITWNYRTSDHIVKVDVWDVVDESPKRKTVKNIGLKLDNPAALEMLENTACDATFVGDAIYKNCSGVLLIFDVTKPWTWNYVSRELEKIPTQIPILIMANKKDLQAERQITEDMCRTFLEHYERKPASNGQTVAPIRYTECSMRNNTGLRFLYNYLNVPFLYLKRESLINAIEANTRELTVAEDELDVYDHGSEANSNGYVSPIRTRAGSRIGHQEPELRVNDVATSNSAPTERPHAMAVPKPRGKSSSTSSDEGNRMVDMYEEDFDPTDEIGKESTTPASHKVVVNTPACPSNGYKGLTKPNHFGEEKPPVGEHAEAATVTPDAGNSLNFDLLDDWLSSASTQQKVKPSVTSQLMGGDSDDERGHNPLVAQVSDESGDSDVGSASASNSMSSRGYGYERTATTNITDNKRKTGPSTTQSTSRKSDDAKKKPKATTTKKKGRSSRTSDLLIEDRDKDVDSAQYDPL
ncbi:O-methyltransferase 1 [Aphelenchoides avenae]|nr:O-methyltransferase 1 [Aphelenchus avenae]